MATPLRIVPVALALIHRDGRYLLIQEAKPKWHNSWFLPGGKVDEGESVEAGLQREVLEEAGVAVRVVGLLLFDEYRDQESIAGYSRYRFVFVAEIVGGETKVVADQHSLQAAWWTPEEIAALPLRSPLVTEAIALHAGKVPLLEMNRFRALSEKLLAKNALSA